MKGWARRNSCWRCCSSSSSTGAGGAVGRGFRDFDFSAEATALRCSLSRTAVRLPFEAALAFAGGVGGTSITSASMFSSTTSSSTGAGARELRRGGMRVGCSGGGGGGAGLTSVPAAGRRVRGASAGRGRWMENCASAYSDAISRAPSPFCLRFDATRAAGGAPSPPTPEGEKGGSGAASRPLEAESGMEASTSITAVAAFAFRRVEEEGCFRLEPRLERPEREEEEERGGGGLSSTTSTSIAASAAAAVSSP